MIVSHLFYLRYVILFAGPDYYHLWLSDIFLLSMYQHRIFYYLFYLDLLRNELKTIVNKVKKMVRSLKIPKIYRKKKTFKKFEQNRLKWIREYYKLIYEMNECLNSVLGWSNLVTILFSFALILTDLNRYYWIWYNKEHIFVFGNFSFD